MGSAHYIVKGKEMVVRYTAKSEQEQSTITFQSKEDIYGEYCSVSELDLQSMLQQLWKDDPELWKRLTSKKG